MPELDKFIGLWVAAGEEEFFRAVLIFVDGGVVGGDQVGKKLIPLVEVSFLKRYLSEHVFEGFDTRFSEAISPRCLGGSR